MNISEFERTKPRKTYALIKTLQEFAEEVIEKDRKYETYNTSMYYVAAKLKELEESFLKGE